MECPPHLLARIIHSGGIINSSGCFYEENYEDESIYDVHDDYTCFGFNCPIARDDDVFEQFEERSMTSDEILQGAQARGFSHHNPRVQIDWKYFEERLDSAIKYYLGLIMKEEEYRGTKRKYGEA